MTLEGAAERAGRWWPRRTSAERLAIGTAVATVVVVAVVLMGALDMEGPSLLIGGLVAAALWKRRALVLSRLAGALSTPEDPALRERERRQALIAKYGHVPLADLATSTAPFAELPSPVRNAPPSPEELERERRRALTAKYGRVPLTELADPRHLGTSPLRSDPFGSVGASPRPSPASLPALAPVERPAPAPSAKVRERARAPVPSIPARTGRPIVEEARRSWGPRASRPGSIVE